MIDRRALCLLAALMSSTAASSAAAQADSRLAQLAAPPPSVPPGGTAAAPSPYDPAMQAGGLAPPPPLQPTTTAPAPPGSSTEVQLDEAKEKDSGRGLELVWLNVEGGFENVGLTTFNIDEPDLTAGFISTSASGGFVGAGVGLRLLFLTLGARGRVGFFSDWQLFTLGGEIGAHIPVGIFDPHVDLGFGYAGLGSFDSAVSGAADAISIRGFYGRASGGLDVYLTSVFSIGANVSWDFLGLTRPGLSAATIKRIQSDPATNPQQTRADILSTDGTSYGSAVALTAVAGLHF